MVKAAQRRNLTDGITGFLVVAGDHFVQIIEGSDAAVQACFLRIEQDSRHVAVTIKAYLRIRRRRFDGWSMGLFTGKPNDVIPVGPSLLASDDPSARVIRTVEQIARLALRANECDALRVNMLPVTVYWNGLMRG
jgi:hypothetical protein